MEQYQRDFLKFAIDHHVLRFGQFTLKSGRQSPYFFNAGLFNTGAVIAQLGRYYAQAIQASGIVFDELFGPAYKGIPLVTTTAIALADLYQRDIPFCFNRKEVKAHGEGGVIVGAPLEGRVLLIDDVITAGTAIREVMQLFEAVPSVQLAGVVISLNRQERGQGGLSAIAEIERHYGIQVVSIVSLEDLCVYLSEQSQYQSLVGGLESYREQWGCV